MVVMSINLNYHMRKLTNSRSAVGRAIRLPITLTLLRRLYSVLPRRDLQCYIRIHGPNNRDNLIIDLSIGNFTRGQLISMSDSQRHEYLAILPDKLGALERRRAFRTNHLENVAKMVDAGIMVSGGAYLDGPLIEGSAPSFKGSVVNIMAESAEEVKEILSQDPFTLNDVWDWEKAQILDFVCAVRKAKP
ncbi:hypothetical protein V1509DRAFT_635526 [Lipomyces kononenkoae]